MQLHQNQVGEVVKSKVTDKIQLQYDIQECLIFDNGHYQLDQLNTQQKLISSNIKQ